MQHWLAARTQTKLLISVPPYGLFNTVWPISAWMEIRDNNKRGTQHQRLSPIATGEHHSGGPKGGAQGAICFQFRAVPCRRRENNLNISSKNITGHFIQKPSADRFIEKVRSCYPGHVALAVLSDKRWPTFSIFAILAIRTTPLVLEKGFAKWGGMCVSRAQIRSPGRGRWVWGGGKPGRPAKPGPKGPWPPLPQALGGPLSTPSARPARPRCNPGRPAQKLSRTFRDAFREEQGILNMPYNVLDFPRLCSPKIF